MAEANRWKLTCAYVGTGFSGWERQAQGERTVQGTLEAALGQLTGERVKVIGASRTDAGVHALGQVAVIDVAPRWGREELVRAINALIPNDLRIVDAESRPSDFHPRRAASRKTYFYQMIEGRFADPFRDRYVCRLGSLPARERLAQAAALLTGRRDFAAFMAAGSQVKSTVRHLSAVRVQSGRDWRRVFFTADGFLYKMIRNMISLIVAVASDALSAKEAGEIVAAGDRTKAPPTFPARGLFLWKIRYENE